MNGLHYSIGVIAAWASLCTAIVRVSLASPVVKLCGALDDIAPYILTNTKPAPKERRRKQTAHNLRAACQRPNYIQIIHDLAAWANRCSQPSSGYCTPNTGWTVPSAATSRISPGVLPMRARNDRW